LSRGYVVASEQDYERPQRQVKAFRMISLVLIFGAVILEEYFGAAFILAVLTIFYAAWTRYLLRDLQLSVESLSLRDSMISQARAHSTARLWVMEISALGFGGLCILLMVIDPSNWVILLGSAVLFGVCAILVSLLLILRRRAVTSA
jgi:hypothetical protein